MRLNVALVAMGLAALPWVPLARAQGKPDASVRAVSRVRCPADMVSLGSSCIDRYEAYVVELLPGGRTRPHSPFEPVAGIQVKAMNAKGKLPQAYISRDEAEAACVLSGKRLCGDDEWLRACKGKGGQAWPYGRERVPGRCNDRGTSSFNLLFGRDGEAPPQSEYTFDHLNDPRLNQAKGTLARSGAHARCKSGDGVFDLVGNLHEWTADPNGTFRGGYYLDVEINGLGCDYRTTAHHDKYHDYSTGFRCCKTPGVKVPPASRPPSVKDARLPAAVPPREGAKKPKDKAKALAKKGTDNTKVLAKKPKAPAKSVAKNPKVQAVGSPDTP